MAWITFKMAWTTFRMAWVTFIIDYSIFRMACITFRMAWITSRMAWIIFSMTLITFRMTWITFRMAYITFRMACITFRMVFVTFMLSLSYLGCWVLLDTFYWIINPFCFSFVIYSEGCLRGPLCRHRPLPQRLLTSMPPSWLSSTPRYVSTHFIVAWFTDCLSCSLTYLVTHCGWFFAWVTAHSLNTCTEELTNSGTPQ